MLDLSLLNPMFLRKSPQKQDLVILKAKYKKCDILLILSILHNVSIL